MSEWHDIAPASSLAAGEHITAQIDGITIAVFNIDGELLAIEDICSHDGGEIACGKREGTRIICPRHGASFCLRTGAALTAPAYEDIRTFPVRIQAQRVEIDIA